MSFEEEWWPHAYASCTRPPPERKRSTLTFCHGGPDCERLKNSSSKLTTFVFCTSWGRKDPIENLQSLGYLTQLVLPLLCRRFSVKKFLHNVCLPGRRIRQDFSKWVLSAPGSFQSQNDSGKNLFYFCIWDCMTSIQLTFARSWK